MALDEKPTMDDSASDTVKDGTPIVNKQPSTEEAENLGWQGSLTPIADPVSNGNGSKQVSSTKEAQNKVMATEESVEYPTGIKLGLISLALCLSVFLMALDNTIIATAIPHITDQFHSLADVGWYGSAYMLATASFQLLFGKFYTFFSIKHVYLTAIGLFEIGSLICGAAPNSIALIMGRAVAGVGSAGIFSGALIIVAHTVSLEKRPMYTGFIGAMYGIASVAGPLLGGAFTDRATWRWCFYINLPIGAITIIVIMIFFKSPERAPKIRNLGWKARIREFDLLGTVCFIPAIVCLLLALQFGGTEYTWSNWRIIVLFCLFGILIICFGIVQFWKQDTATIPPKMMKQRSMWAAAYFSFCIGCSFLLLIYFLPIWFQAVKGASAVRSGIMNLPMVLSQVLASVFGGIGVTMLGYYAPLMIVSTILSAAGAGMLSTFSPASDHSMWIGYQCLAGIGFGFGLQQPLIAVQTVLDISDVPVGTSIIVFVQILGGALFVSVGENVFSNKLIQDLAKYAPSINPEIVLSTGATSIQQTIDKSVLPGVTLAYNNALDRAFLVSAIMAAFTIVGSLAIEWRSVKEQKPAEAAAVAAT